MFNISQDTNEVSTAALSRTMGTKMPTVNSMMKRLAEKKLVTYESYRPLKLTEEGYKTAALIVRKHRLTEMFLTKQMGFGWEEVHEIAEQLEHVQSSDFFDRMDEILGFPTEDPHGAPIPDKDGNIKQPDYIPLSHCKTGDRVVFKSIQKASDEFLKYLNSRELPLGTVLHIHSREDFDGSMMISYEDKSPVTFSQVACERILVKK